jgi:N-acetylneuraminate synthase
VAIEKHFTLARADGGPDAGFSLEAPELAEMVTQCRTAWAALGRIDYGISPAELSQRDLRRSLYVTEDVPEGGELTPANLRSIRPGFGLSPRHLPEVLGRRAARPLRRGEPLDWSMLAP